MPPAETDSDTGNEKGGKKDKLKKGKAKDKKGGKDKGKGGKGASLAEGDGPTEDELMEAALEGLVAALPASLKSGMTPTMQAMVLRELVPR